MADRDGEDPDNPLPFTAREPSPQRPRPIGDGQVTQLGSSEPAEPWGGDEEWISTLTDPHDTTKTDEPE